MKKIIILIICCIACVQLALAQVKYEREYRLEVENVPKPAQAFIAALQFSKKIKWYREEHLQGESVEAKTKHAKQKYSIEFSADGQIEDIEIEIPWKNVPLATQQSIMTHLDATYDKTKMSKVQIQYVGTADALIAAVLEDTFTAVETNYEIVLKAKQDRTTNMMEYLFSTSGEVMRQARIILKNTDNLEY